MSDFTMLFAFNATSSIRNTYFKSGAWLGLGPSDPAAFPQADHLVSKMHAKGWISRQIFSLIANGQDLQVSMGGVNERLAAEVANHSRYTDQIVRWQNMSDPRKWSFQYSKIYMNETVIDTKTFSAYLDLNSTNIRVPRDHL
jgi:hypothetical protein